MRPLRSIAILVIAGAFVLGCNSGSRTAQSKDQFELKQTNQGQIVRLNKETGEIDIIEAGKAAPARTAGKSRSSTVRRRVTTTPYDDTTTHPKPEAAGVPAPSPGQLLTLTSGAPIFVTAQKGPTPLLVVSNGAGFRFRGVEGEWYRVEWDDPRWGKRVGFVENKHAIVTTEATALQPVDLSIRDDSHTEKSEPIDQWRRDPAPQPPPGTRPDSMARSARVSGTLTVTIVGAQDTTSTFRGVVPGFSTGQANGTGTCTAFGLTVNCSGAATGSGFSIPPRAYEYAGQGATYALRLPDNRVVTVTCAYKEAFAGMRSCRRPMSTTLRAKFDGNKAKLIWPIGIDGRKTESETYTVVRIDAPAR